MVKEDMTEAVNILIEAEIGANMLKIKPENLKTKVTNIMIV
jgi:hypothetical protein